MRYKLFPIQSVTEFLKQSIRFCAPSNRPQQVRKIDSRIFFTFLGAKKNK